MTAPIPADDLKIIRHLYPAARLTYDGRYVLVSDLIDEIERLRREGDIARRDIQRIAERDTFGPGHVEIQIARASQADIASLHDECAASHCEATGRGEAS